MLAYRKGVFTIGILLTMALWPRSGIADNLGEIRGHVYKSSSGWEAEGVFARPDSVPIARAKVEVGFGAKALTVFADAGGFYEFSGLAPGVYFVHAYDRDGLLSFCWVRAEVEPGSSTISNLYIEKPRPFDHCYRRAKPNAAGSVYWVDADDRMRF
jgi:hypothetical protein